MRNKVKHANPGTVRIILFGMICCMLYGLGAGIRCNVGILVNPLMEQYGVKYDDVTFSVALMQLVFGASQPLFGIIASKRSNRFVLSLGTIFLAVGIIGIEVSHLYPLLIIFMGIFFGAGAGAISFGIVLTSAIKFAGKKNAMLLAGMLNASAGMLGFILAPLMQTLLTAYGLKITLICLTCMSLLLLPIIFVVTMKDQNSKHSLIEEKHTGASANEDEVLKTAEKYLLKKALNNRTYRLLIAGFSTCGFHMVIIESHLFSQFVQYGIARKSASWAFSVYSLATIAGALLSGYLSSRMNKGKLLGFYYGFRGVWTLAFLFIMPKNIITAVVYAVGLGFTGDATVSPTSGLVNNNFELKDIATLIGVLFLCHQVGAFFSAWLGGMLFELTGNYTAIWMIDVVLCLFASSMSFKIQNHSEITV